jgi:hypothetical protein
MGCVETNQSGIQPPEYEQKMLEHEATLGFSNSKSSKIELVIKKYSQTPYLTKPQLKHAL